MQNNEKTLQLHLDRVDYLGDGSYARIARLGNGEGFVDPRAVVLSLVRIDPLAVRRSSARPTRVLNPFLGLPPGLGAMPLLTPERGHEPMVRRPERRPPAGPAGMPPARPLWPPLAISYQATIRES